LVTITQAERHAKGFSCWSQFVSMLFCQLGRAHSLREISGGLRSCEGKLKHLGIPAPSHSTLAYANEHRPWELYQQVFLQFFERCRVQVVGKRTFRFKNKLISMDSTTIAAIYKERWQIEIFLKALKQNLKIKTFVGTSANAVKIQIWTALIAMLILRFLQLRSQFNWSLSNLVALLRMNLFTHRDLWAWLSKPFEIPPAPYEPEQLKFCLR
jgi:hypothetical protein